MLKKENRLKKESSFQWVFRRSKPVFFDNLVFRVVPAKKTATGPVSDLSRFGLVISAKTEKSAVRRNAIRRYLYSLIKEFLPSIREGIDVVVVIKKSFTLPLNSDEIRRRFRRGGELAGIFRTTRQ
ncbi:MAG: ribonuclease P protein component [Patescibacteria group bacterium]|jgi:ribonuclease P protein component